MQEKRRQYEQRESNKEGGQEFKKYNLKFGIKRQYCAQGESKSKVKCGFVEEYYNQDRK